MGTCTSGSVNVAAADSRPIAKIQFRKSVEHSRRNTIRRSNRVGERNKGETSSAGMDAAMLQLLLWPLLSDVDVLHSLQCNRQSYAMITRYRIKDFVRLEHIRAYRSHHPLVTSIVINSSTSSCPHGIALPQPRHLYIDISNERPMFDVAALPSSLHELTLTSAYQSPTVIDAERAKQLDTLFQTKPLLQHFTLGCSLIQHAGATIIARAVQVSTTLRKVVLHNDDIRDDGATTLALALQHNTTLCELSLCNNNIGNDGVNAMATALEGNTALRRLNLSSNQIGADGGAAIARALQVNRVLRELYLSSNHIANAGSVALANALQHNSALETLKLRSNNIGEEGASAIATALQHNTTLLEVDLSNNYRLHQKMEIISSTRIIV